MSVREPTGWQAQSVPLTAVEAVVAYGLLLVGALLPLLFGSGWEPAYALLVVGVSLSVWWGRRRARQQHAPPRNSKQDAKIGGVISGISGAAAGAAGPAIFDGGPPPFGYFALLGIVIALIIDPYYRRRYRQSLEAKYEAGTERG